MVTLAFALAIIPLPSMLPAEAKVKPEKMLDETFFVMSTVLAPAPAVTAPIMPPTLVKAFAVSSVTVPVKALAIMLAVMLPVSSIPPITPPRLVGFWVLEPVPPVSFASDAFS